MVGCRYPVVQGLREKEGGHLGRQCDRRCIIVEVSSRAGT